MRSYRMTFEHDSQHMPLSASLLALAGILGFILVSLLIGILT